MSDSLRELAFVLLALVGPGWAAHRLARVPVDAALLLPLGIALTAGSYWASLVLGTPWLFPVGVLLLDLTLVRPGAARHRAVGPSLRSAILPAAAVVGLLAVTQYPWNRLAPDGRFLLDPLLTYDTTFHVGLVRELTLGYPPQLPGVAGFPIHYHLGTDLVRAAALRWAGIGPFDSISRFDVTVFAFALVLAVLGLAARLGADRFALALAPATLLATDFSFVLAGDPRAHWWSDLFRGNLLLSLVLANPVVPALALALGAWIALARHEAGEGRGWLLLAVIQAAAVPFFKVFLGAHLLLGLGVGWICSRSGRRGALLAVGLPVAVATALLSGPAVGGNVRVEWAPLDLVHATRATLGLGPVSGWHLLLFAAFWLLVSLGLRSLGLPEAVRSLRNGSGVAGGVAAMALVAWPLALLFRVSAPETLPTEKAVNDVAYLLEQGGVLLWIFTAIALSRLARTRRARGLAILALLGLGFPSTLQFPLEKAGLAPEALPAPMVRAMAALRKASAPGDVVLQRPGARYPPAPVILLSRRVPYERFTPYRTQFAPAEALEHRHQLVYDFFRSKSRARARRIAQELGARFLCLYGGDRVRFDVDGVLEPVHEEPGARCYRLDWSRAGAASGTGPGG